MLYILDTDHVSLLQRSQTPILNRLTQIAINDRAVTIVTVAEQMQGRLAVIRRAQTEAEVAHALTNLQNTQAFFQTIRVLLYDEKAQSWFAQFRQQKIRVGTQDLRIAAIVLSQQATLVTRNARDFQQIPGLAITDWSY